MSMCQEITIAKIGVQNLAEFCIGKQREFMIQKFLGSNNLVKPCHHFGLFLFPDCQ